MLKSLKTIVYLLLFSLVPVTAMAGNVVFVVIDGARYTETFGDPQRTYIDRKSVV